MRRPSLPAASDQGVAASSWPMYRYDPRHTSRLDLPGTGPRLQNPTLDSNGVLNFDVPATTAGAPNVSVEVSTDLVHWSPASGVKMTAAPSGLHGLDTTSGSQTRRYHRVTIPQP